MAQITYIERKLVSPKIFKELESGIPEKQLEQMSNILQICHARLKERPTQNDYSSAWFPLDNVTRFFSYTINCIERAFKDDEKKKNELIKLINLIWDRY